MPSPPEPSQQLHPPGIACVEDAPLVLCLSEVTPAQRLLVGGKSANLATMLRAGLPVPKGFCITTAAFARFMASCPQQEQLAALMAGLSADQPEQIASLSRQAQECLEENPVPPPVQDAVLKAWRKLGMERTYAVRSSATVEDGKTRSFAGQFDSILDVRGAEALLHAIKTCWLSLFSERALAYLARGGMPAGKTAMAVLVQELITADCSGVVFTADPLTGAADRILVESVAGLGEALVQGRAKPERLLLEKATRRELVSPPPGAVTDSPKQHLPGQSLQQLLDLAARTELLFGEPQDIEWARRAHELFLLQSRPITTHGLGANDSGVIWSNMNTAENFQEVVTPMAWSFLDSCAHRIADPLFRGLGIDPEREPWMGLIAGRVYMNVSTACRILQGPPGFREAQIGYLFGGHQDAIRLGGATRLKQSRRKLSLWGRLRGKGRVIGFILRRVTWRGRKVCTARLNRSLARFLTVDCQSLSDDELSAHLNRLLNFGYTRFQLPAVLGFSLAASVVLRRYCAKWLGDADGSLANQLLSHAGGMPSAEAALDLWRLAVWTSPQADLRRSVLAEPSFASLAGALALSERGRAFLQQWAAFMAQHGHRARGEVDLAAPRWSETPDEVLRHLRHYLESTGQLDLLQLLDQRTRARDQLLAESRCRLRNPLRRWVFSWLVRQAQAGLVYRENLKNDLLRVVAYFRRLLLELGERMARAGKLEQRDDVFFLTLEELEPVRTGVATFDAPSVIRARREEYRKNQTLQPPPVVIGKFDPAQSVLPPVDPHATVLSGLAVSPGVVIGRARVILSADTKEKVLPGEILVAPYTDPGWTPLFLTAAGLVVDLGGQLSHGSVVAREYGLPAVVNVRSATQIIRTGQLLQVDGNQGVVTLLAEPASLIQGRA